MRADKLFLDGARIHLGNDRVVLSCLLDLCPDRHAGDCHQQCPSLTVQEARSLIARQPKAIVAKFLAEEIGNAGKRVSPG